MGTQIIGIICKVVASYLNLSDYMEYTKNCLQRTSAILLVDRGGTLIVV